MNKILLLLISGVFILALSANTVKAGCPAGYNCVPEGSVVDQINCDYKPATKECKVSYSPQISYTCSCPAAIPSSGAVCSSDDGCVYEYDAYSDLTNCYVPSDCTPPGCCDPGTAPTPTPGGPTPTPGGPTPTPGIPSCTVFLYPASASISVGLKTEFLASVTDIQGGTVDQVNFISVDTGIAGVDPPGFDTTVVYRNNVTGVAIGNTTIRAGVIMSGVERCSDTSTVAVTPPGPWWQVVDSDVTTSGDIVSHIYPEGTEFILKGLGGYPGVAVYGGQAVFDERPVSSEGWLANTTSTWLTNKTYNYDYFRGWLPATWWDARTTTPGTINTDDYFATTGTEVDLYYRFFYHEGDLTIDALQNMGSERAVLFVDEGNLTIKKNISLDDGLGFFMAIVKGNIIIDPAVASLEGFYSADNEFRTGTGSVPLTVRGSVVGLGGVLLERNLGAGNTANPAEVFEYAPDLVFTYPSKLMVRKMRWKEVAP